MKHILSFLFIAALLGCTGNHKGACLLKEIGTMPAFEEGFSQGVSACYAAAYNNQLFIAGGCNFPETPAAQGGAKRYYRGIYAAATGDTLQWRKAGELPQPSAYGANIQHGDKWYIAGGMNEHGTTATVIRIDLADNCRIDTLPPLPCPIDNTAGAVAHGRLYIVGGNADGTPSNRIFSLTLSDTASGWQELQPLPSRARVQPVCAATSNALYVWGGFSPADSAAEATVHTDGARLDLTTGAWTHLPDISINGTLLTLSGGMATTVDDSTIVAVGGVNREIFTDAVSGKYALIAKEKYMLQPAEWYKFNPRLLRFRIDNGCWEEIHRDAAFARAGATILSTDGCIYYIGGELKPGIRTPQIHRIKP